MTVSTTTAKVSYTGNGSTTAFAVPFVFFGSSELEVIERTIATGAEVVKTLTTHYTVTGGDGATGTVTALTAPASTVEWHIRRKTARTQLVDYQAHDAFPADTHERALDRAAARDQEIEEKVGRALVFPKTDASTLDPELPASVDRATKLLGFDSDGNPVVTTMTLDEIEEGATDAAASAVAAAASAGAASGSASTASAAATAASGSAVAAAASAASIALPLPIGSGGTGATTADAALWAFINGATAGASPAMADKIPYGSVGSTAGRFLTFQQHWNSLNGLTAYSALLSTDEIAIRDGGGANGVRKMTVANFTVQLALPRFNCKLTKNGSNLQLDRRDGQHLWINGKNESIPSAGVTLAPSGSTPGTTYYIYAYMNAGTMTLEYSATAPATDATYGHKIKTGDGTRTLVGMARPIAGPAWVDTATQRLVISYYNRDLIRCSMSYSNATGSGTPVQMGTNSEFLTWGPNVIGGSTGTATNNTVGGIVVFDLYIDGSGGLGQSHNWAAFANSGGVQVVSGPLAAAEGYHTFNFYNWVNAGVATASGSAYIILWG